MTGMLRALVVCGLATMLVAAVGCEGEGESGVGPSGPGPFRLTFSLDASFQGPHGGQPITIALLRSSDGTIVAEGNGLVSSTLNPSFTFSTGAVMQRGVSYDVHYWIDSNIGGGAVGVCDPEDIDHQWSTELLRVSNDITITTSHNPALIEDVCATFA